MTGYTRNDTSNNIETGNVINASDLDGEFDAIQTAFNISTGHRHNGTSGEGAPITVTGPAQDFVSSSTDFKPKADNTYDLGTAANEWKDLYVDGVANIDTLTADAGTVAGADITTISNTQTLTNKTINLTSNTLIATSAQLAAALTDETGTGSVVFSASPALTGTPTAPTAAAATNTTQIATTAHVFAERTNSATLTNKTINLASNTLLATSAQLAAALSDETGTAFVVFSDSPALTGTPTAPTAAAATNTTQIATTAHVFAERTNSATLTNKTLTAPVINGDVAFDTNTLFVDATNNRVGVGTTTPTTALDVNGDITVLDKIIHSGDTDTTIRFPAANTITFETAGSERMRINALGNFSIGTTIPVGKFNVTGGTLGTTAGDEVNVSTFTVPEGGFNLNLSAKAIRHTTGSGYLNTEFRISSDVDSNATKNAWLSFYSDSSTLADNIIRFGEAASTEWMRIDNGLVGIGTTSPAEVLDVNGNIKVADGATVYSNGNLTISADQDNNNASSTISFNVDNLKVSDFNSVGYLRFNKASFASAGICNIAGDAALNIGGGANPVNDGVNFSLSGSTHVSAVAGFQFRDGTTVKHRWDRTGDFFFWNTGGSERVRITSAGNFGIGTATPVTPLDVNGAVISRGVVYRNQPAQTSKAAAATLTIAELLTGIVQYTGSAATLTLPTGTDIEGGVPATFPTNMSFDFSVINTGSGAVALGTATGLTLTGSMSVAAGESGLFRVRKTGTNAYTFYRIS